MSVYADIQKLEPGDEVELFDLDARAITGGGPGDVSHFHGYTQVGSIFWQGIEYKPWPIELEGIEYNTQQPASPTFTAGNVDGSLTVLCLNYQDLVGAIISRHCTFGKYLDGQPGADPSQEFPPDQWRIEQKTSETKISVQWMLSSALDFGGQQLPGRAMTTNMCTWLLRGGYRGPYCGYTGGPVAKADDTPTNDPALDRCSGTLNGCWFRFGKNNPIPYGGFPATGLLRT